MSFSLYFNNKKLLPYVIIGKKTEMSSYSFPAVLNIFCLSPLPVRQEKVFDIGAIIVYIIASRRINEIID
jgi:hypothetical protein